MQPAFHPINRRIGKISPLGTHPIPCHAKKGAHWTPSPALPHVAPFQFPECYCNSFVTSCCMLLACANAEMPVWLRISYFDMFEVAEA